MTTQSWNTVITHTNDAQFRAWGSELNTRLAAIGLVQTADTGQINWVTATRPGTNTAAGYEIWRFNDSLQGTAPIFFKLEYGTGNLVNAPATWLTVGTGSNGAGAITGSATTRTQCSVNTNATSTITNYQSYACSVEGLAWVANKILAGSGGRGFTGFVICRTCDSAGAPTATGFTVYMNPQLTGGIAATSQAVRTAAPAQVFSLTTSGLYSFVVHGVTSSVDGLDTQAYLHWMPTPKVLPVFGVCAMIATEAVVGTTFTTTLVGSTPRTFLSVELALGYGAVTVGSPTTSLCLVYE